MHQHYSATYVGGGEGEGEGDKVVTSGRVLTRDEAYQE